MMSLLYFLENYEKAIITMEKNTHNKRSFSISGSDKQRKSAKCDCIALDGNYKKNTRNNYFLNNWRYTNI